MSFANYIITIGSFKNFVSKLNLKIFKKKRPKDIPTKILLNKMKNFYDNKKPRYYPKPT